MQISLQNADKPFHIKRVMNFKIFNWHKSLIGWLNYGIIILSQRPTCLLQIKLCSLQTWISLKFHAGLYKSENKTSIQLKFVYLWRLIKGTNRFVSPRRDVKHSHLNYQVNVPLLRFKSSLGFYLHCLWPLNQLQNA